MTIDDLVVNGKYKWQHGDEQLTYIGKDRSSGHWHQFALIEEPYEVWCEVLDEDLKMMEEIVA